MGFAYIKVFTIAHKLFSIGHIVICISYLKGEYEAFKHWYVILISTFILTVFSWDEDGSI